MSPFESMQHLPLSSAYLCEDCHCIGNCSEQCPACAGRALLCLAGVLNREKPEPKKTLALMKYQDRWAVEDPVLDCAIFLLDREYYRQMREDDPDQGTCN